MYDLVTLGEMMLCLSSPKHIRLRQTGLLNIRACGAQFNIAANLASLGKNSAFLTALPNNDMGLLAKSIGASVGVDMSYIKIKEVGRMGLIFLEHGAEPRKSIHIYDRQNSTASTITSDDFVWEEILNKTTLAYFDGIFPALNDGCKEASITFMETAKSLGRKVCFDVNYRESLWDKKDAATFYRKILPGVNILVTNRFISENLFNITGTDKDLLLAYKSEFGCDIVCLTYRTNPGTSRGGWNSLALFGNDIRHGREFHYEIVDRFGTGDAFFAGFLYGFLEGDIQYALDFGNALCALAHTIDGDQALFSAEEVNSLLAEEYSFVIKR